MTEETLISGKTSLTIYRDAPVWRGRTATVGKFKCEDAEAGAEMLSKACDALKSEGFESVIGPMDGSTWHAYRLVLESDGSAPFVMEPQSKPQNLAAFEKAGFEVIERYFSARVAIESQAHEMPEATEALWVETWDGTDPEGFFRDVHALSLNAFSGNVLYKPISEADFLAMYLPYVPMLVPDLILFARGQQGELAGFLFGLPNYAEGRAPSSVILKTYASLQKGAGAMLAQQFHATAHQIGFSHAIHALIHEDNLSATRSRQEGAGVIRRYGLMGRRLG
ncbi:hypothetical protein [Cognatishimia sp. MH4019]|uniref:hypothetical protein n=1 Tax=Cognatishimia sp. MH4019 TaxID=2854030 RepID=UPI001CD6A733|nr:hypothetical protein [Cognatishimia sp. MH4019]